MDLISATVHARYAWIETLIEHTVRSGRGPGAAWTERLDAVLTHKLWGWPAFFLVMATVLFAIFRG